MSQINVLFVHSVNVIGGAERMTEVLIKGLDKSTFNPSFICPSEGALLDFINVLKVDTSVLPIEPFDLKPSVIFLKNIIKWYRYLRKNKIDILHVGDLWSARTLVLVAKLLNIPVLCHMHFRYDDALIEWIFKGLPKPTGFIYCSNELQLQLKSKLATLCPKSFHTVIHNGIDLKQFNFRDVKSGNNIKIGIVANLGEVKGHEYFLEMAKILINLGYSGDFDVIGGDILSEGREIQLKKYATVLGIIDKVNFIGQVQDVRPYIASLDILVLSSIQEALPVSILEAMAIGVPVVATNVGGVSEIIEHGVTGCLVPSKDPESLADAVFKLLESPIEMENISKCALQNVKSLFSLEHYVSSIEEIYIKVIKHD
jgi:glycosyltransferase involved in cell wall biosynthesis